MALASVILAGVGGRLLRRLRGRVGDVIWDRSKGGSGSWWVNGRAGVARRLCWPISRLCLLLALAPHAAAQR